MMAETYLLQALQAGINSIRQNTTQLADILSALSPNELTAAQTWFANPANTITIAPGFPSETTPLPFIGVTVADETQILEQTGIGLDYYNEIDAQGNVIQHRGARFIGQLKATIYTQNADLIVWLSAVCKWSLLTQYDWFGEQGFNNVQIGLGDFEPSPQFLPFFTFARGVFLRGEYDQTFKNTPSLITSTQTIGNYQAWNPSTNINIISPLGG
jgi:hypothetical protein